MAVVRKFLRPGQTLPESLSIVNDSSLRINLIANNTASYPGTGNTWTNLGTMGSSANFTIGSGVVYEAASKSFKFSSTTNNTILSPDFQNNPYLTKIQRTISAGRGGSITLGIIENYTYEFWLYFNGNQTTGFDYQSIFGTGLYNTGSFNDILRLQKPDASLPSAKGALGYKLELIYTDYITSISSVFFRDFNQQNLPLDGWYHVVVIAKNMGEGDDYTTLTMYVQGGSVIAPSSQNLLEKGFILPNDALTFNFLNNDFYRLNTFRVYDRALSFAEIQQNYNATQAQFSPKGQASVPLIM